MNQSLPQVNSRLEAEEKVATIAHNTNSRDRRMALFNEELTKVRERFSDVQILSDCISNDELALEKWATENPAEFEAGKQSIEFRHGIIGFRKGREKVALLARRTWDDVLAKLQAARKRFSKCIRHKEEPNLIELLAWAQNRSCEERAEIGIKLTQDDKFYVSLKAEEVKA